MLCTKSQPNEIITQTNALMIFTGSKVRIDLQGDTTGQATKGFKIKFRATKESAGFKCEH